MTHLKLSVIVISKDFGWFLKGIYLLAIIIGPSLFRSHSAKEEEGDLVYDIYVFSRITSSFKWLIHIVSCRVLRKKERGRSKRPIISGE